jgi:aminoglycoside/choline kinase family phosphotransferase
MEYARERFGPETAVIALAGDASTRAYYRAVPAEGESHVVAAYSAAFDPAGFPFLEATALLQACGVPVPDVLGTDGPRGLILLEDLGDRSLQDAAQGAPGTKEDAAEMLYTQAVEIIARLQGEGTPRVSDRIHAGREALDAERFRFELGYFFDNLVLGLRQRTPGVARRREINEAMDALCADLDGEPRVLCHRDFHSRNIMVGSDDELSCVDHQDARLGPDTYDLVSLLRDPYVDLPEDRVTRMIDHYRAATGTTETLLHFRQRFDRMAVQRTLKAAGTYAGQMVLHQRDSYLRYLPRALELARRSLERCPDLERLHRSLGELVPELGSRD